MSKYLVYQLKHLKAVSNIVLTPCPFSDKYRVTANGTPAGKTDMSGLAWVSESDKLGVSVLKYHDIPYTVID